MFHFDSTEEPVVERQPPRPRIPPKTSREWLEKVNLPDWPSRADGEGLCPAGWEFDSKEAIAADLERHAPLDIKILEEVEAELLQLEEKLSVYSNVLFEDRQRDEMLRSNVTEGLRLAPHPAFLTEFYDHDVVAAYTNTNTKPNKKGKTSTADKNKTSKNIEDAVFPGFSLEELTPLPGLLEAPQILAKVTQAQAFKPGFMKHWKKIFLSHASVAILQDAFWWLYLDQFQSDNAECKAQLFGRTADSYVALFCAMNPDFKDKFFQHYADCLAQAIFTTFCLAYPDSRKTFHDDEFKTRLINVVWEWIAGVRPPAGSWAHWKVPDLDPAYLVSGHMDSDDPLHLPHRRVSKLSFDLTDVGMASPVGQRKLSSANVGASSKRARTVAPQMKFRSATQSSLASRSTVQESEQIGPGPTFERVLFDTKGHSPLISHYLQSRQLLSEGGGPPDYMKRTQLAKLPPPAPTHQHVIRHANKVRNKLEAEYERDQNMFLIEEQRIRRQNVKLKREFRRLSSEIMSRRHEMKMLSEQLVDSLSGARHVPMASLLASVLNPVDMSDFSGSSTDVSELLGQQKTDRSGKTTDSRSNSAHSMLSKTTMQ